MPDSITIDSEAIFSLCQEKLADLGRSLTDFYGSPVELKTGELTSWEAERSLEGIKGGGHLLSFLLGEECLLIALPNSTATGDTSSEEPTKHEHALETLADEWSQLLLPSEVSADHTAVLSVENVAELVSAANPLDSASVIDLAIHSTQEIADAESEVDSATEQASAEEAGTDEAEESQSRDANADTEEPFGRIHVIWPVQRHLDLQALQAGEGTATNSNIAQDPPRPRLSPQARRLMKLPVSVVVRLAEKRIEIGQLRGLNPGSLIKFSKSCEDLLDLYVNNQAYCRGEAVKIGEKFGLKVIEVGNPTPPSGGVVQ